MSSDDVTKVGGRAMPSEGTGSQVYLPGHTHTDILRQTFNLSVVANQASIGK